MLCGLLSRARSVRTATAGSPCSIRQSSSIVGKSAAKETRFSNAVGFLANNASDPRVRTVGKGACAICVQRLYAL